MRTMLNFLKRVRKIKLIGVLQAITTNSCQTFSKLIEKNFNKVKKTH